jgi:hypothetical protein
MALYRRIEQLREELVYDIDQTRIIRYRCDSDHSRNDHNRVLRNPS